MLHQPAWVGLRRFMERCARIPDVVQVGEDLFGYAPAEVRTPAPEHWRPGVEQRHGRCACMPAPAGVERPLSRLESVLARGDPQLNAAARTVGRRILPKGKAPKCQPSERWRLWVFSSDRRTPRGPSQVARMSWASMASCLVGQKPARSSAYLTNADRPRRTPVGGDARQRAYAPCRATRYSTTRGE